MTTHLTAADALDLAADILEVNGFDRHHWWNPGQAAAGIPREDCRVDITGALGIALHGDPRQVVSREVRELEALLVARIPAPCLEAWYHYPGIRRREVLRLLRSTAAELRAQAAA